MAEEWPIGNHSVRVCAGVCLEMHEVSNLGCIFKIPLKTYKITLAI